MRKSRRVCDLKCVDFFNTKEDNSVSMEITKAVGSTIRNLRTEQSLSQEELADLTNLHRTYISSVERGKRNISIKNLEKIAKALKVKISNILEVSGN